MPRSGFTKVPWALLGGWNNRRFTVPVLKDPQVKYLASLMFLACLQGCAVIAVADAAASAVVYGVKTTVNVLDAVTPDIVNKKKKE